MDKYILYAEDDEILLQYLVDLSSNAFILGVMSSELNGEYYGKRVFDFEYGIKCALNNNYKIIIVDKKRMLDCVRHLQNKNLELIYHWMPYWLVESNEIDLIRLFQYLGKEKNRFEKAMLQLKKERKIVVFHGNCHTHAIMYYLKNNKCFGDEYRYIKMPQLWNAGHISLYEQLFELEIFKYADYLFIQSIRRDNRFSPILSSDNVLKYIDIDKCKVYMIPNMFSEFYFRQACSNNFKGTETERSAILASMNKFGLTMFSNKIDWTIADLVNKGLGIENIINNLISTQLWDKEFLLEEYLVEYKKNMEREERIDVKVEDFIESNMRNDLMFVADRHPTEKPLVFLANCIMDCLGLNDTVGIDSSLKSFGISDWKDYFPIYPAILSTLGLKDLKDRLYNVISGCRDITFEEYIYIYVLWVYGVLNRK